MGKSHSLDLEVRRAAFLGLGSHLRARLDEEGTPSLMPILENEALYNSWFTPRFVLNALRAWADLLSPEKLDAWLGHYDLKALEPKTVAVVAAGNLPLVGLHDALCVLASGHKLLLRPSQDDARLLPWILKILCELEPQFNDFVRIADGRMAGFDAVIATGSNNSGRYFEHYFGRYPHIIRGNRTSVAILDGSESPEELAGLADDAFLYFGMGCRSVSQLWLPKGFDLNRCFEAFYPYHFLANHHSYANNYEYQRSILLMNNRAFLENGFLVMLEEDRLFSPVACLHYRFYDSEESLRSRLTAEAENLQVVVGRAPWFERHCGFGEAQKPAWNDYADGVDVMRFLAVVSAPLNDR